MIGAYTPHSSQVYMVQLLGCSSTNRFVIDCSPYGNSISMIALRVISIFPCANNIASYPWTIFVNCFVSANCFNSDLRMADVYTLQSFRVYDRRVSIRYSVRSILIDRAFIFTIISILSYANIVGPLSYRYSV